MIERNLNFTRTGFPVDYLWSDIEYAYEKEYFVFDSETWPQVKVQQLNTAIQASKRRLAIITDPHIYTEDPNYPVYKNGNALVDQTS